MPRYGYRLVVLAVAATVGLATAPLATPTAATAAGTATAATAAPPSSMASLGDSITRGFNACGFYLDCPARSFATGDDPAVGSHYLRILTRNPAIAGRAHNDGVSGAVAAGLARQASNAVRQGVGYVTVLIGANDACAGSEAGMTPVATFRTQIDTALDVLRTGLPEARVLVASVPDLYRLWQIGSTDPAAIAVWELLRVCRSMLARPVSTAPADADRRARVRQRVVDYNGQLAQACAAYGPNCAFDGNAVFGYRFTLADVSSWDYFHPNATGQARLADLTYPTGFGW